MSNEIMCEKCGSQMRPLDPQKPIGMTCDKCGWGWATTYIEPILSDTTTYCLTIRKMNSPDAKVLRVLANVLNCNYIKAKEQVTAQDVEIFERATSIKEYAITLCKNGIPFDISPDFPYEIK
jgi:hypothetical protein